MSVTSDLELMALAGQGTEAAAALPMVESFVSDIRKNVFGKVFQKISAGKLSPEEAYNYWQELYAAHRLLKKCETAISLGKSAAAKSPPAMEGTI